MTIDVAGPIVLVGAGNMGGAMMRGWLASGVDGGDIVVLDPSPRPEMLDLIRKNGARHIASAVTDISAAVLFIAIKPQMMSAVLPALRAMCGPSTVAVSIAAGTPLSTFESHLGEMAVVRAMPNTPAMVARGITAAVPNGHVSDKQRRAVDALLAVSGPVEWLDDESLIDAVTAVSGSGPAYVFFLAECMAEAGRLQGLPADLAMRLARATVSGAGEMLRQSPDTAEQLRRNVTSPGGTTAAALDILMSEGGLGPLMERAIEAARKRAEELSR